MGRRLPVAAAICALTLLNYFQFPGHTYLQADTQIYVPILEHIWDPSALPGDLIVQKPHVSFTLYDEVAEGLRKLTGLPFRLVLAGEQIFFRALGIFGLYLIASSAGLPATASLLVTAIVSLGATIGGPSVLSFEYEPTPRGFAVPLLFLGIGLIAQGRYLGGSIAGSAAFLLHAPTAYPFWAVYLILALARRKLYTFAPLLAAAVLLWIAAHFQAGAAQAMTFFTRLDGAQESVQRLRASYVWISLWASQWLPHYAFLYAVTLVAVARLWKALTPDLRFFAIGLPLIGMLSVPISYLTLEKMKLAVIPQFQPLRALLFVSVMAALLAAIAACMAVQRNRYWEAIPWLVVAYLIPVNTNTVQLPPANRVAVVLALTGLALLGLRHWSLTAVAAVAAFFVIPLCGKVINYTPLHNAALAELSQWARASTPKSAVFLFPDANRELYPGVFRAEALRSVYVDWKAGGQVNYFKDFGEQWWSRWQEVMAKPFDPANCARYAALGIDYIIVKPDHKLTGRTPAFENSRYVAYQTAGTPIRANPGMVIRVWQDVAR
jgi:hypothetical protein